MLIARGKLDLLHVQYYCIIQIGTRVVVLVKNMILCVRGRKNKKNKKMFKSYNISKRIP